MKVARWRIAAAVAVLAALLGFGALFLPIYVDNLKLQSYVSDLTRTLAQKPRSDQEIRADVVAKANQLNLPVKADNVHVDHSPDGIRVGVRYFVRVNIPFYTVDLHFYPGAGSK